MNGHDDRISDEPRRGSPLHRIMRNAVVAAGAAILLTFVAALLADAEAADAARFGLLALGVAMSFAGVAAGLTMMIERSAFEEALSGLSKPQRRAVVRAVRAGRSAVGDEEAQRRLPRVAAAWADLVLPQLVTSCLIVFGSALLVVSPASAPMDATWLLPIRIVVSLPVVVMLAMIPVSVRLSRRVRRVAEATAGR